MHDALYENFFSITDITVSLLDWTQFKFKSCFQTFVYLASAFALVDDLQSVLPSRRELHAFAHNCKVPVAQHPAHPVAVRYVGRHNRNFVLENLNCRRGTQKVQISLQTKKYVPLYENGFQSSE